VLKIQTQVRPTIIQVAHHDKYISQGHKHLAPGIRVAEKEEFFSAVFESVEGTLISVLGTRPVCFP
jgi:hypothetical protein